MGSIKFWLNPDNELIFIYSVFESVIDFPIPIKSSTQSLNSLKCEILNDFTAL